MAFKTQVISGKWKGKALFLPDVTEVRPTKSRVRHALFNLLMARTDFDGKIVADVCCGSGLLGIEAASRGAEKVFCIDADTRNINKNLQALNNPSHILAIQADAKQWEPPTLVDIVLADPPYASDIAQKLLAKRDKIAAPDSLWIIETSALTELDTIGFEPLVVRDYGQSRLWVLEPFARQ